MPDLPKIEDWKAPWEVDSTGVDIPVEDQKLEPARLKKYLHNLLTDKDRLQATVTTVTGERDSAKADLDAKLREGEGEEGKRKREHEDAVKAAEKKGALAALKLDVALEVPGITPAQARKLAARLTGEDRDALAADAKGLAEDFGIGKEPEHEDSSDPAQVPGRPRRPRASGDPDPLAKPLPDASDSDAVNKLFPRR